MSKVLHPGTLPTPAYFTKRKKCQCLDDFVSLLDVCIVDTRKGLPEGYTTKEKDIIAWISTQTTDVLVRAFVVCKEGNLTSAAKHTTFEGVYVVIRTNLV